jgi:hypothetical protein
MSGGGGNALQKALALARAPLLARPRPDDRLPEGMLTLLKLVAGEEQASAAAQVATGESPQALKEAAAFYLQQVLFAPDASSYRVLGVDSDAADERLREHYRWLARWLHPDRNPDEWEAVYAERVGQAWQNLRTPDRRERYDRAQAEVGSDWDREPVVATVEVGRRVYVAEAAPPPSPVNLRWVPKAIFAGLGVTAVGVLGLFSILSWSEATRPGDSAPAQVSKASTPVEERPAILEQAEPAAVPAPAPAVAPPPSAPEPEPAILAEPPRVEEAATQAAPQPAAPRVVAEPMPSAPPALPVPKRVAPPPKASPSTRVAAAASRSAPGPVAAAVVAPPSPPPRASPPEPVAVETVERAPAETGPRIGQSDANRLLSHFSRAFEDGDLGRMRAMFAADITSGVGNRDATLADYNRLFGNSRARSLQVRDVSWFATDGTLTIVASFDATITDVRDGKSRRSHGDLRMDLRREDSQWRIFRLKHAERRG